MALKIEEIKDLGAWMRETGVRRVRLADGTELEMGSPPATAQRPAMSPAEVEAMRIRKRDDIAFGASSMRPRREPVAT